MYHNLKTWKNRNKKITLSPKEKVATSLANLEMNIRKFEDLKKKTNETFEELERKAEGLEKKAEELTIKVNKMLIEKKATEIEKEWKERMEDLALERYLEKSWNPRTKSYF